MQVTCQSKRPGHVLWLVTGGKGGEQVRAMDGRDPQFSRRRPGGAVMIAKHEKDLQLRPLLPPFAQRGERGFVAALLGVEKIPQNHQARRPRPAKQVGESR